jgi:Ser/Thr protein kinase RdoA (MazF antagonist)
MTYEPEPSPLHSLPMTCRQSTHEPPIDATIERVLSHYPVGPLPVYKPLCGGLINQTWDIVAPHGRFVLQRLSDIFDERTIYDYAAVQPLLAAANIPAPPITHTNDGDAYHRADGVWRLSQYIAHDPAEITIGRAHAAGAMLARLHDALAGISFEPAGGIPGFHDSPALIDRMRAVVGEDCELRVTARKEYEFLLQCTPKFYTKHAKRQLIHGDPKFANFLFRDERVVGVIDFDTLMIGDPLLDIGDALRSWSTKRTGTYEPELFDAALSGYQQIRDISVESAARATALITLELAARFLTDAVEKKQFVPSDPVPHEVFCLRRCREQLDLYARLTLHHPFLERPYHHPAWLRDPLPAHW